MRSQSERCWGWPDDRVNTTVFGHTGRALEIDRSGHAGLDHLAWDAPPLSGAAGRAPSGPASVLLLVLFGCFPGCLRPASRAASGPASRAASGARTRARSGAASGARTACPLRVLLLTLVLVPVRVPVRWLLLVPRLAVGRIRRLVGAAVQLVRGALVVCPLRLGDHRRNGLGPARREPWPAASGRDGPGPGAGGGGRGPLGRCLLRGGGPRRPAGSGPGDGAHHDGRGQYRHGRDGGVVAGWLGGAGRDTATRARPTYGRSPPRPFAPDASIVNSMSGAIGIRTVSGSPRSTSPWTVAVRSDWPTTRAHARATRTNAASGRRCSALMWVHSMSERGVDDRSVIGKGGGAQRIRCPGGTCLGRGRPDLSDSEVAR